MERGSVDKVETKAFKPFEDFDIWRRAFDLSVTVYKLTKETGFRGDGALRDQIRRAAISVPLNVAEGYERRVTNEFRQFLSIAKGSCGELRTQLRIVKALNMIEERRCDELIDECMGLSAMIGGFMKSLASPK